MRARHCRAVRHPVWMELVACCVLCGTLVPVPWSNAAEVRRVSIARGSMEVVDVPFAIFGIKVANDQVVKAEALTEKRLRLVGLTEGSTDVQVTGEGVGSQTFRVSVLENVQSALDSLRRSLDEVPEVELSVSMGRVMIRGEVNNIQHWQYLQKVVEFYGNSVANLATFRPAPEVIVSLKKALAAGGFKVMDTAPKNEREYGALYLNIAGNKIYVSGSVFSQGEMETITAIVQAEPWVVLSGTQEVDEGAIYAILNVSVIPTMLELDVAFVSITENEEEQIGVNLAEAGLLVIDTVTDPVRFAGTVGNERDNGFAGSYSINSSLQGALQFFASDGPQRRHTVGHMTFRNDAKEFKEFKSGGSIYVRVAGGNAADLEEVEYGLFLKAKGGLVDANNTSLDLEVELSFPTVSTVSGDLEIKEDKLQTTILCPLGHTMVMGGLSDLFESVSNDGVPYLRKVPVVNLLFSQKGKIKENRKVLILASPHLAPLPKASKPASEHADSTLKKGTTPLSEQ